MSRQKNWGPAFNPEDLARLFLIRANAGDVDGLIDQPTIAQESP